MDETSPGERPAGQFVKVVFDLPQDDLAAVKRLLRDGTRDGWWDYEEGCISDAWQAAGPT